MSTVVFLFSINHFVAVVGSKSCFPSQQQRQDRVNECHTSVTTHVVKALHSLSSAVCGLGILSEISQSNYLKRFNKGFYTLSP